LQGPSSETGTGRLEVLYRGKWGTICSGYYYYYWDRNDATVVCRQLGYLNAVRALPGYSVPDGSGQIWLSNVRCNGKEQNLTSCLHSGWGNNHCRHSSDVGVVCSSRGKFTVKLTYSHIENNCNGSNPFQYPSFRHPLLRSQ
jgi:hypothetical protein